jgi:hypothetical protein
MSDDSVNNAETPPVGASLETLCSRCGQEPREPGQRWGRRCLTAYQRERRHRDRERRAQTRGEGLPVYRWNRCRSFGCEYFAATRTAAFCCNLHGSGKRWHSADCRRRRTEPR